MYKLNLLFVLSVLFFLGCNQQDKLAKPSQFSTIKSHLSKINDSTYKVTWEKSSQKIKGYAIHIKTDKTSWTVYQKRNEHVLCFITKDKIETVSVGPDDNYGTIAQVVDIDIVSDSVEIGFLPNAKVYVCNNDQEINDTLTKIFNSGIYPCLNHQNNSIHLHYYFYKDYFISQTNSINSAEDPTSNAQYKGNAITGILDIKSNISPQAKHYIIVPYPCD